MKIIIDARKISDFGIGEYIRQLLVNYNKYINNDEYLILVKNKDEFPLKLNSNFRLISTDTGLYSLKELFYLGLFINGLKGDIIHFPHFTVPLFIKGRVITTIHDLIHLKYMDLMFSPLHKYYLLPVLKYAIRRSDAILTVSEKTKNDIIHYYGIGKKRLDVIYNGLNGFDENRGKNARPGNIRSPYFLYVGNLKFHKNLINIIRGFAMFEREAGKDIRIVLAGVEKNRSLDGFLRYTDRYIDRSKIITTGYLSSGGLAKLYENSLGLCLISLCEGFGLPALEAMHFQIPVIASKDSPMEEFLKENGIYVDPYSIKEIKNAFSYVYNNQQSLRKSVDKARLKDFQWSISAERTYNVYREVYESAEE